MIRAIVSTLFVAATLSTSAFSATLQAQLEESKQEISILKQKLERVRNATPICYEDQLTCEQVRDQVNLLGVENRELAITATCVQLTGRENGQGEGCAANGWTWSLKTTVQNIGN